MHHFHPDLAKFVASIVQLKDSLYQSHQNILKDKWIKDELQQLNEEFETQRPNIAHIFTSRIVQSLDLAFSELTFDNLKCQLDVIDVIVRGGSVEFNRWEKNPEIHISEVNRDDPSSSSAESDSVGWLSNWRARILCGNYEIPKPLSLLHIRPELHLFFESEQPVVINVFNLRTTNSLQIIEIKKQIQLKRNNSRNHAVKLFVIIHGFTGNICDGWMNKIRSKLEFMVENSIVMLVGWKHGCKTWADLCHWDSAYMMAVANTSVVGVWVAEGILMLSKELGLDFPTYLHGIGHNLGSHILAVTSRHLGNKSNIKFDRITGLDPTGVGYQSDFQEKMLSSLDAKFVDVIHTDALFEPEGILHTIPVQDYGIVPLGTMLPLGHVDFYPDFGIAKPNFSSLFNDPLRSYSNAHIYFIDSIGPSRYRFATNKEFKLPPGIGQLPEALIEFDPKYSVVMGYHCTPETRGNYAVDVSLYGRGIHINGIENGDTIHGGAQSNENGNNTNIYPQSSRHARYACIINITEYEEFGDRLSALHDTTALLDLLENKLLFPYEVLSVDGYITEQMIDEILDDLLQRVKLEKRKVDSILLSVNGHGNSADCILTSSLQRIKIEKKVKAKIQVEELEYVPKKIFINCCRGSEIDAITMCYHGADDRVIEVDDTVPGGSQSKGKEHKRMVGNLPRSARTLVVLSTNPGQPSYRYSSGTWFMQNLVDVIISGVTKDDVEITNILNKLQEMAEEDEHFHFNRDGVIEVLKQQPVVCSYGFTKKFYFYLKDGPQPAITRTTV